MSQCTRTIFPLLRRPGIRHFVSSRFARATSAELISQESKYSAHNYEPVPVVFSRAQGVHVWDPEGRQYYDFLSAYSAVNQGHCHPKIVKAAVDQMHKLTLSSRAFHNDVFPRFAEKITSVFGYDSVLPMNTGVEAVESSIKVGKTRSFTIET